MRAIFGKLWRRPRPRAHTTLGRLATDVRGNTLAIMAAALIPLCGMVGGGMDMARLYITKTRLQHACDAGALAGRKNMGAGSWDATDNATAVQFFNANYNPSGMYGSAVPTVAFTENAGKVTGAVSAVLPMTLMRVLGKTQETLTVSCDAEMKLPNTDVMFVLDTTGSMNCVAGDTTCSNNGGVPAVGSKIDGLKTAVKCFYEVLAQLDTNAACTTGTPSGGTSSAVQVRFGFMPYASNVNVGHLLPSSFFANTWTYQSRVRNTATPNAWADWYAPSSPYRGPVSSNATCSPTNSNTSARQYRSTRNYYNGYGYYCYDEQRDTAPNWDYKPVATTVSGLKNGTGWNSTYSFTLPINDDGSNRTITWDGCIEERATVQQSNYDPIPAGAKDLDIDGGTSAGLWGPALSQLIYYRAVQTNWNQVATANVTTTDNYYNVANYTCPTEAKKLQAWPDASAFDTYVDSLEARGNTYHDIGMIWGARFMSPTGIFASENATASNGGQIQRHMIFMTDGDATSNPCDYNAYGVPWFDQRQTTDVGTAGNCVSNRQPLIDQINKRLEGLCTAVKNKGITLWVVSYGGGVNPTTESRLNDCASDPDSVASTHYFSASNPAALQNTFAQIANAISQLRLTR